MGLVQITDNSIWLKHVEADEEVKRRLAGLKANQTVWLEIEGKTGKWAKMRDGKDGRPTPGLRPEGAAMQDFWKTMQARRGAKVSFSIANRCDNYLERVQSILSEWESEEDEEAFRDL